MIPAGAEGVSIKEEGKALTLKLDVDSPWAYRSKEINVFHNAGGKNMNASQESDALMAPLFVLSSEYALKDKVTAFVQLCNVRLAYNAAGCTYNENADFGGGWNMTPQFSQAYIKVEDFITEKLAMSYGIQPLKLTLRKGEGAFFMDTTFSLTPSRISPVDSDVAARVAISNRGYGEFSGLSFTYGNAAADNYDVGFFYGVTGEFPAAAGLRNEDRLLGLTLTYKLAGEDNVVKALLTQMSNSFTEMSIMTLGIGADYFGAMPNKALEIYGEFYTQSGTASNQGFTVAKPFVAGVDNEDVDQSASAFRVGAQYNFAQDLKPYVGLSYWTISGGDDSQTYNKNGVAKYTENNHFISYENANSTMILEDNLYGLNFNSNYTAIKVEAGITTSLKIDKSGEESPLHLKLLMGTFSLDEAPCISGKGPDGILGNGDDAVITADDGIGTEIDIVATLEATKSLSLSLGLGMLTGGDFFDNVEFNSRAGKLTSFDSMKMVMFKATLSF
jgi:hypothetical protein